MSTHGAPRLIKLAPTHSSSSIHCEKVAQDCALWKGGKGRNIPGIYLSQGHWPMPTRRSERAPSGADWLAPEAAVEIVMQDEGLVGSRYPAIVVSVDHAQKQARVEHEQFFEDDAADGSPGAPLRENTSFAQITPRPPPPPADFAKSLCVGMPLEVFHEDGWWEVTLHEIKRGSSSQVNYLVRNDMYRTERWVGDLKSLRPRWRFSSGHWQAGSVPGPDAEGRKAAQVGSPSSGKDETRPAASRPAASRSAASKPAAAKPSSAGVDASGSAHRPAKRARHAGPCDDGRAFWANLPIEVRVDKVVTAALDTSLRWQPDGVEAAYDRLCALQRQ
jgi:hypothetical protein